MNVAGGFSSHCLLDRRMAFFSLHPSFSEPFIWIPVGKEELKLLWEREDGINQEPFEVIKTLCDYIVNATIIFHCLSEP